MAYLLYLLNFRILWMVSLSCLFCLLNLKDGAFLRKSTFQNSRLHVWWNLKEKLLAELECWEPAKWFSPSGGNWKKGIIKPGKCSCWWKCWQTGPAWCHCCEKSINIGCIVWAAAYVPVVSCRACHIYINPFNMLSDFHKKHLFCSPS